MATSKDRKSVFEVPKTRLIKERIPTKKKKELRIGLIPDLQAPFEHPDAYDFVEAVTEIYQPDVWVNLGDEADKHALGDWDTDPDGFSAGFELEAAIEHLTPFYKLHPKMHICTSNHTNRIYRKAYKHGIPRAYLKDYKDFLQAPKGWKWADVWECDGILFEHGEGFSGQLAAIKAAQGNSQSTCIGHVHAFAGIQWNANPKHLFFGFNVGCLIDSDAYAFRYGRKMKSKPILGMGIIDDGVPFFIPMRLNTKGRWNGKLR